MGPGSKGSEKHRCHVCGATIPAGTTCHKQTGIFEGEPYAWKAHTDCAGLHWKINRDNYCFYGEAIDVYEMDFETIKPYRGKFPHAVCRIEKKFDEMQGE